MSSRRQRRTSIASHEDEDDEALRRNDRRQQLLNSPQKSQSSCVSSASASEEDDDEVIELDFVAHKKYRGFQDYRGGGHFSGRLTLALVAAGVVAKKITPNIQYGANLQPAVGDVIQYQNGYWELDNTYNTQYFVGKNPDYPYYDAELHRADGPAKPRDFSVALNRYTNNVYQNDQRQKSQEDSNQQFQKTKQWIEFQILF